MDRVVLNYPFPVPIDSTAPLSLIKDQAIIIFNYSHHINFLPVMIFRFF